ncbi:MAG TPA: hypothetical protein VGO40_23510 [Longimicrobium sp.]|jgi:hypothetical protein|nr:hypothetical protein [Longimicrobium sp.]
MKRLAILLVLATSVAALHPAKAASQCHEQCVTIHDADGNVVGRGCVWNMDLFTNCLATASVCFMSGCNGAFVTDGNGAVLAQAEICRDKVTLSPVRRAVEDLADVGDFAQTRALPRLRTRLAEGAME